MFTSPSPTETQAAKSTTGKGAAFIEGANKPFFQPKLTVNTPGDAHEQEADRVADQVMRMQESDAPIVQRMSLTPVSGVQRKCAACEQEEQEQVQRKETGSSDSGGKSAPSIVSEVISSGGGQPMDGGTRQFMESRFGQDFGQVRIHTDSRAAESASAIQARAYTSGRDLVFGKGEYQPDNESGKRLLAHELVHVGQQGGGVPIAVQRYEGFEHQAFGDRGVGDVDDATQHAEGRAWFERYGYNPDELHRDIRNDPYAAVTHSPRRIKTENTSVSPGEATSLMGDLYGSWEALNSAPAAEITEILNVMELERRHEISGGEAAVRYERITRGRYTQLAEGNVDHFSPENARKWQELHSQAVQLIQGNPHDEGIFNQAVLMDASAGHFLTDAFAAGHLLNKRQLLAEIRLYLMRNPPRPQNPEMGAYLSITASKHDQLALKNIHDHFNIAGFEVTNPKGMRWRTYGDGSLDRSPETLRIASLAVFLSRRQLFRVRQRQVPSFAEVTDLLPDTQTLESANRQAIGYIPTAVSGIENLIFRNRDASSLAVGRVFAPFVRANLDAVGDPGRPRQIEQMTESAARNRTGPVVVPQFTIFRF